MDEQEKAGVLLCIAVAAAGAIGFSHWMQSAGAGWWYFATELLVMDAVSELAKAIRRSPK